MSRSRTKKRTHSFVILSDDDNPAPVEKRLDPIIVLSDDDDPPPAKRSCPTVHKPKLSHNALRATKEKGYVSVSDSSDEEENEDLIVAAKQAEILASTVQVGIDMAMRDAYIASKDQNNASAEIPKSSSKSQSQTTPQAQRAHARQAPCLPARSTLSQITQSHNTSIPRNIPVLVPPSALPARIAPVKAVQKPQVFPMKPGAEVRPRQVLGEKPTNIQAPQPPTCIDDPKLILASSVELMAVGHFLSFSELTAKYSNYQQHNHPGGIEKACHLWLDHLGINQFPYSNTSRLHTPSVKATIENEWAFEPAEKRRAIERLAIYTKSKIFVNMHIIPLRERNDRLHAQPTMPFHEIERIYFNYRPFEGYADLTAKRDFWLHEIGFGEARPYPPPRTADQTGWLNQLYDRKFVLEKKETESRARYVKYHVTKPAPSWTEFEKQYEVYPANCYTSHASWVAQRSKWLKWLGLDSWPFNFINISESSNELAEIAWSEKTAQERAELVSKGKVIREYSNEMTIHWRCVEEAFGFTIDSFVKGLGGGELDNRHHYETKRLYWLRKIGMSETLKSVEFLQGKWDNMRILEKKEMIAMARAERHLFCSEYALKIFNGDGSKPREWITLPLCLREEAKRKIAK
ncbi:hypothetical protein B0J14DRAFT_610557 [Halenospora varia]|nr:hypothetical protein B0J14DRAFT_610557 [Halenospora varia]